MAYRIVITTYMQCFTKSGITLAEQWAWGRLKRVVVSLQKMCLDVSCGEKDPYFVYNIDKISAYTRSTDESTVRAKWASERWFLQQEQNG